MSTSLDRERMVTNNQSSAGKTNQMWAVEERENPDKGEDKACSSSSALQVEGQE